MQGLPLRGSATDTAKARFQIEFATNTVSHFLRDMFLGALVDIEFHERRRRLVRPKVGEFPYLAKALRRAGVTRNIWSLPACQSLYLTKEGPVVTRGTPLVSGSRAAGPVFVCSFYWRSAPTPRRLVAVSTMVSDTGRGRHPSSRSALALESRRFLPSSNS